MQEKTIQSSSFFQLLFLSWWFLSSASTRFQERGNQERKLKVRHNFSFLFIWNPIRSWNIYWIFFFGISEQVFPWAVKDWFLNIQFLCSIQQLLKFTPHKNLVQFNSFYFLSYLLLQVDQWMMKLPEWNPCNIT